MQSETAISRELMGKIVDEVFDGAIEDASVIEEIYAVIKREEANLSKVDERKPLDLNITQDWFEKRSALEADHEIGAGGRKLTASIDPTPDELAELFKIAHRIPDGWKLVPVAALSAAEPVGFLIPRGDVAGADNEYYSFCEDEGSAAAEADIYDKGYFPVYAAPPAPSVALKAFATNKEMIEAFGVDRVREGSRMCFQADGTDTWEDYYEVPFHALDRIRSALSAQVQDVAEVSPAEYMRRHDAAIAAYEANTPSDYRYSALALRKAVDAAFAAAAAPAKQEGGE